MTTERFGWLTSRPESEAHADACVTLEVCGCGQDLDCCSGPHCPRCGVTLTAYAVTHAA